MKFKEGGSLFVLTGAGVSAESGLNTFRGAGGLWEGHRVEEVASPEAFQANPDLVQKFYNERRHQLLQVDPNKAHFALVELENQWPGNFLLVTQNVDDLHERAGSKKIVHMHGEVLRARCLRTNQVFHWTGDISNSSRCECCQKTKTLRPHIVWFGEMPLFMEKIFSFLAECDLFLSVGTSGNVYPAAGFVQEASGNGRDCRTVEINKETTVASPYFDQQIQGLAGEELPKFVGELLSSG